MAIGFLLKLGNSAYLECNGRMAISSKLITCLLFSIYLGCHLDLCLSIQVSIILVCQTGTYTALCSCHCHVIAFLLKVVTLPFSLFVKVITLLVIYVQLTGLLPSHILVEPHLVVLKHYGKREVLHLINQMEDCFDRPFEFNPEAIEVNQEGERGQCCGARPMGLWYQCVWEEM